MKPLLHAGIFISTGILLMFLSACQKAESICQWATGTPRYITTLTFESSPIHATNPPVAFTTMEIRGRQISINQVIEGPLCNGTWSGIVYVTCNVQVYPWEEQPTFLKNCDLQITPGTVVYVAYHNNTAYYNGCSCHTGEIAGP